MERVLIGKRGELKSALTDEQAIFVCRSKQGFGAKLAEDFDRYGRLSSEQLWWAHKIAQEAAPKQATNLGDLTGIVALFDKAGAVLKAPKIRLRLASGKGIRVLKAGSASAKPGTFSVLTDADYGDHEWLGRIELDGRFLRGKACSEEVVELLHRFAADPKAVALEYGKATGNCCFCGRELEEEGSVTVGYGPICAGHYGLPHPQNGDIPSPQPEALVLSLEASEPTDDDYSTSLPTVDHIANRFSTEQLRGLIVTETWPQLRELYRSALAMHESEPAPTPNRILNTEAKLQAFLRANEAYELAAVTTSMKAAQPHLASAFEILKAEGLLEHSDEIRRTVEPDFEINDGLRFKNDYSELEAKQEAEAFASEPATPLAGTRLAGRMRRIQRAGTR